MVDAHIQLPTLLSGTSKCLVGCGVQVTVGSFAKLRVTFVCSGRVINTRGEATYRYGTSTVRAKGVEQQGRGFAGLHAEAVR